MVLFFCFFVFCFVLFCSVLFYFVFFFVFVFVFVFVFLLFAFCFLLFTFCFLFFFIFVVRFSVAFFLFSFLSPTMPIGGLVRGSTQHSSTAQAQFLSGRRYLWWHQNIANWFTGDDKFVIIHCFKYHLFHRSSHTFVIKFNPLQGPDNPRYAGLRSLTSVRENF